VLINERRASLLGNSISAAIGPISGPTVSTARSISVTGPCNARSNGTRGLVWACVLV